MREIKFRAWDKFNGCYYYSDNYKNLHEFFELVQLCIDGGNEVILEQFTGLKDKNGKEIYEGDKTQYGNVEWLDGWCINGDRPLSSFKDIEVTSNTHENPELIKNS